MRSNKYNNNIYCKLEIKIHILCSQAIFRDYIWSKHLLFVPFEMTHRTYTTYMHAQIYR